MKQYKAKGNGKYQNENIKSKPIPGESKVNVSEGGIGFWKTYKAVQPKYRIMLGLVMMGIGYGGLKFSDYLQQVLPTDGNSGIGGGAGRQKVKELDLKVPAGYYYQQHGSGEQKGKENEQ